jgi:tetratricopeptide (TPR) repeat protein
MEDENHKGSLQEEIDREIAAAEEQSEGGEEEEETEEELTEEDQKIVDAITKENMRDYLAEATAYKVVGNYEQACHLLKLVIHKGEQIYGDALHPELASYYYMIGDFLMEEIENEGENIGQKNQEMGDKPATDGNKNGTDPMDPGIDPEAIQSAWENLETARHILQKRLDQQNYTGDEEKTTLISKLAIINSRIGDCECWQDKFIEAIAAYNLALELRESIESSQTSRAIAEIYFMLANATAYTQERLPGRTPVDYYSKAAKILQNILVEKYEKAGVEVVVDSSQIVQKGLVKPRLEDDDSIKEVKSVLSDLYQRLEDAKIEEEAMKQCEEAKRREKEEDKQVLNAFGKPIAPTEDRKIKNLGTFGRVLLIERKESIWSR